VRVLSDSIVEFYAMKFLGLVVDLLFLIKSETSVSFLLPGTKVP